MAAASADGEKARLAVHEVVVEAAVGEGLEAEAVLAVGVAGDGGRAGGEVGGVGRGRRREGGGGGDVADGGRTPEEAFAIAEVRRRGVRGFGKVGAECLFWSCKVSLRVSRLLFTSHRSGRRENGQEIVLTPPAESRTTITKPALVPL